MYRPTNTLGHVKTGPGLRVSSDKLEEPGIDLGTRVYKASSLSTTPRWLISLLVRDSPKALRCVLEQETTGSTQNDRKLSQHD